MDVLTQYCQSVECLRHTQGAWLEERLLSCLLARDAIARALQAGTLKHVEAMRQLLEADAIWHEFAPYLAEHAALRQWRSSIQPPPDAWWWYPPPPAHRLDRYHWLCSGLTLLLAGVVLSFITNIATRFYQDGIDLVGSLAIVVPALLTSLSAGGVLSPTMRTGVDLTLERLNLPLPFRHVLIFGLALTVLLGVMIVWFNLPRISRQYNNRGVVDHTQGRLASARDNLERAIRLDPDNAVAHYNLGNVYEDLLDEKKALIEYRIAAVAGLDLAYNNLGRLLNIDGHYDKAVQAMHKARRLYDRNTVGQAAQTYYDILKNLGWARVGQKRFREALDALKRAADLFPTQASSHCLLGKAHAALENVNEARIAWDKCIRFATASDPDVDHWIHEGRAYLRQHPLKGQSP